MDNGILINALEIGGGLIFMVLGIMFSATGFPIWGYFFDSLAVACGIGFFVHHLKKSRFKQGRKLFWTLMGLDFILYAFLSWHTFLAENSRSLPALAGESIPDKLPEKMNSNLPRHYPVLDPNALERIKAKLIASHSKNVMVFIVVGDSDDSAERFSNQLYDLFWECGFTAAYEVAGSETNVPAGLTIRVPIEFSADTNLQTGLAQLLKENESSVGFTKMEFTTPPSVLKDGQAYDLTVIIGKN